MQAAIAGDTKSRVVQTIIPKSQRTDRTGSLPTRTPGGWSARSFSEFTPENLEKAPDAFSLSIAYENIPRFRLVYGSCHRCSIAGHGPDRGCSQYGRRTRRRTRRHADGRGFQPPRIWSSI